MIKREYETLFNLEEIYWWFIGQRFLLQEFLVKYYNQQKHTTLLDVGCGTGINLQLLSNFGKAEGIDITENAKNFCQMRGLNIKISDVMDIQYKANRFDVVSSLGVFYHKNVTDDIKGMKEIYRILKPGGRLFFLDSAMPCLYGKHDIAFHGIRRYSQKELQQKLHDVGFIIEKISYINVTLFPLVYLKRKLEKLSKSEPKSEVDVIHSVVNFILKMMYLIELKGLRYVNYPFGINIFAIARKN